MADEASRIRACAGVRTVDAKGRSIVVDNYAFTLQDKVYRCSRRNTRKCLARLVLAGDGRRSIASPTHRCGKPIQNLADKKELSAVAKRQAKESEMSGKEIWDEVADGCVRKGEKWRKKFNI